jgi:hypothetical protein
MNVKQKLQKCFRREHADITAKHKTYCMMKTLAVAAVIAGCVEINAMECVLSEKPKESVSSAVTKVITEEQVSQAWDEFDARGDYWDIAHDCDRFYEKACLPETSQKEAIELLEDAICGPKDIIIRSYLKQEEQRFVDLLNQSLRQDAQQSLLEICSKYDINFSFIYSHVLSRNCILSFAYKLSSFSDAYNKKRSVFWILVEGIGRKSNYLKDLSLLLGALRRITYE